MLGKTNAIFVTDTESAPVQLVQETILTVSTADIEKIEYVNGYYFAFLSDEKVLYGKEINSLGILKNGEEILYASHVIYADGKYYFARSNKEAMVYASEGLNEFTTIAIKDGHKIIGLYKSTEDKIVILVYSSNLLYMLVATTLESYQETESQFIEIKASNYFSPELSFFRGSRMIKDRIIMYERTGNSNAFGTVAISMDGTRVVADSSYNFYAHGHFYSYSKSNNTIYYSVNGINYSLLGTVDAINSLYIMEFDEGVIGLFFKSGNTYKFSVAEAPTKIISAVDNAVEVNIIGNILTGTEIAGHTYIGCSGGVILKTYADYSGSGNAPDAALLKTLSAKQALTESKKYTDELIAALEARIALLEAGFE